MQKPSGLKPPGRGGKHSSPMGRMSIGSTSASAAATTTDTCSKEGSPLHKQNPGPPAAIAPAPEKPGAKVVEVGNEFLGDFVVGEHVWVNGVKPGVVQYLGETQFALGQWAGVVLDEPVGKNTGAMGGMCYFECPGLQGIFTRPSKLTWQPAAEGSDSDAHSVESQTAQNLSLHSGMTMPPLTSCVIPLQESVLNSWVKTGNESGSNLSDSGSVKQVTRTCACETACWLVGPRLAWCSMWGRQTLPRASGVAWSWTSPLGRMTGQWRAPGTSSAHTSSVSSRPSTR